MTTWYIEQDAAAYLQVPEKALKNARYRKKIKSRKFCGVVQYMQEWLDQFREGACEDSRNLSNVLTLPTGSSTYRNQENPERSALARAKKIIAKQRRSLGSGSLKEESRNSRR